jgi:hypothetical protein
MEQDQVDHSSEVRQLTQMQNKNPAAAPLGSKVNSDDVSV